MTPPEPLATRPPRSRHWRVAALTGASLVLVGGAAVAMAASPAPSSSPDPDGATEQVEPAPLRDRGFGFPGGFAGPGHHGGFGFGGGEITITAIDGASLTLETVDGWTRTIEVTSETEITKEGEAAEAADLEVGDRVRFRQTADDDDTYTITELVVVQPTVVGEVTATDGDAITLQGPDGSSVTVNVDDSTEFIVGRETGGSLADIEVGMLVLAAGDLKDDGSLEATRVVAGVPGERLGRGHRHGPDWFGPADPPATPEDESSTSAG